MQTALIPDFSLLVSNLELDTVLVLILVRLKAKLIMKNLLFFCLFFPCICISQHHSSFDFHIGANFVFTPVRSIIDIGFDSNDVAWGAIQGVVKPKLSAQFSFRVYDKIMISTGLAYSQIGIRQYFIDLRNSSKEGYKLIMHSYLDIPLLFRQEFGQLNSSFYVEAGFSSLIYLRTKTTWNRDPEEIIIGRLDYQTQKRLRFALTISIGKNYLITDRTQLFAQISYKRYANLVGQTFFEKDMRSIGFSLGIRRAIVLVD